MLCSASAVSVRATKLLEQLGAEPRAAAACFMAPDLGSSDLLGVCLLEACG